MHGRVIVDNTYEFQYHYKNEEKQRKNECGCVCVFCGNYSVFDFFFVNLRFFFEF